MGNGGGGLSGATSAQSDVRNKINIFFHDKNNDRLWNARSFYLHFAERALQMSIILYCRWV